MEEEIEEIVDRKHWSVVSYTVKECKTDFNKPVLFTAPDDCPMIIFLMIFLARQYYFGDSEDE